MTTAPVLSVTDELLAELEAAADNASPGPWGWDGPVWCYDASEEAPWLVREDNGDPVISGELTANESNALYLAVANPSTMKALLAHIAELKRDAERYRWLRNPDQDVSLVLDKMVSSGIYEYRAGDELDAAIDAAMQEQSK